MSGASLEAGLIDERAASAPVPAGWLQKLVDSAAALLLIAEIAILLCGVIFRYGLKAPLIWSDELASILFIWLGMLGAISAMLRSQHMRLTTFVMMAPPPVRNFLDGLSIALPATFLLCLFPASLHYATAEADITTPALALSNIVRAAALPVGIGLMALIALARLMRLPAGTIVRLLVGIAAGAALIALAQPLLQMMGNGGLIFFFVVLLLASVMAGVPIAFAFGTVTLAYLVTLGHAPLEVIVGRMDEGMSGIILLAVPLFVFLGAVIEVTGIASAMIGFLVILLGHVRGGLKFVLLGAMYLVSGISGAKAADMAAITPILFPEMKKRGTDEGEMLAILASSAAMSEIIAPSIVLIAIGSVASVSIAKLFTAGLVPAALLAFGLAFLAWLREPRDTQQRAEKAERSHMPRVLAAALPALALPFLIRFAVSEGIATATEVSTLAILYSLFVGIFIYRRFDAKLLWRGLSDAAALSGMILLIIGTASGMAWAFTTSGFSQALIDLMSNVPGGKFGFLAASIIVFALLGSILEGIPAVVLLGPLLFPVAKQMGVHEVHYAMVVVLAMGVGLFSPPFGVGYYTACVVGRIDPTAGMRKIWPYMAVVIAGILLVACIPYLSLMFIS